MIDEPQQRRRSSRPATRSDATDRARADGRVVRAVHRGAPATRSPRSRSSTPARTGKRLTFARGQGARRRDRAATARRGRPSGSGRPTRRSTARRCAAPAARVLTDLVSLVRFALDAGRRARAVSPSSCASASTPGCCSRRTPAGRSRPSSCAGSTGSATTSRPRSAITRDDFDYAPFVERGRPREGVRGLRRGR